MQPAIMEARPPFVQFETRSEENRQASVEAGNVVFRDVDYAIITPQGSKDRVERVASEWFQNLESQVRQERFPREWLLKFKDFYRAWKEEGEIPLEGTALKNWPMLTPAQVKTLTSLHIRTVEELATANEESIARMGMGGRALKDKAVAWVGAKGSAAGKQAEELVDLRMKLQQAEGQNKFLQDAVSQLQAQVQALQNMAPQMFAQAQAEAAPALASESFVTSGDLLDDPAPAPQPRSRRL